MTPRRQGTHDGPRTLVVAGLGVRALAESARQGGWEVIALDLFGDADTRGASTDWLPIGDPGAMRIDPARLHEALRRAARHPRVDGWVPGGGFEGAPGLLAAGGAALPCLALDPAAMARLRDPACFFDALDRQGLSHPPVSLDAPADPAGWLAKRGGGCGGMHVRDAAQVLAEAAARPADTYFQRRQPGAPMSALFVADGRRFHRIALNRLVVHAVGRRPFVYAGAIGPVADDALERAVDQALSTLVPEFELRGLASLDFIAHGSRASWLEINPRPSATMQLHAGAWPRGLMRVHVDAVQGRLPADPPRRAAGMRGHLTVFADRAGRVADAPVEGPHVHARPLPGTRFAPGEPLCTVSAEAGTLDAVRRLLDARAAWALHAFASAAEVPA
jgi:predicted ATP-grasp superfamily ATP-dependent carboligase